MATISFYERQLSFYIVTLIGQILRLFYANFFLIEYHNATVIIF